PRDPAWWVLAPASALALGIVLLALGLRGMGIHIPHGASSPPAAVSPTPSPTPRPAVWIAPDVPGEVALPIASWVSAHPEAATLASAPEGAAVAVQMSPTEWTAPLWERIYVVAVPYKSRLTSLGSDALRQLLQSPGVVLDIERLASLGTDALRQQWQAASEEKGLRWLAEPEALDAMEALLGPQGQGVSLDLVPREQLASRAWEAEQVLAFLPFDHLEPRLRPLQVDGYAVLDPTDRLERYPLALRAYIRGPAALVQALTEAVRARTPLTNRDPARFASLAVTGNVSLTRGVAVQMDALSDPGHPVRGIGPRLAQADATLVGLLAPFTPACQPQEAMTRFCSRPAYVEALRVMGADAVYLTDGHLADFGPEGISFSLGLLEDKGFPVVGTGRNRKEAFQTRILSVGGARVALLAYNQAGPPEAWATEEGPGTARFDLEAARTAVVQARAAADLVLVLVQHEDRYSALPNPQERLDFRALADAGADLIVGTEAHEPRAAEFYGKALLAYGLGNPVSDQMWSPRTRQSTVLWCTFYGGRWLGVDLLPTQMEPDGQARWLAGAEARAALEDLLP
ncbi:MAG: CapA family protein, partial [Anaerolineae bacterium]